MTSASLPVNSAERQAGSPWPVADAAKFLHISARHLIRLMGEGKVTSFTLGRRRLIADAEVARIASGN